MGNSNQNGYREVDEDICKQYREDLLKLLINSNMPINCFPFKIECLILNLYQDQNRWRYKEGVNAIHTHVYAPAVLWASGNFPL